jgi:alpha-aminoadipate carrier protein LysW
VEEDAMLNPFASCPVCDAPLTLAPDAVVSELVACQACYAPLEVRSLDPVVLDEAPHEEEDWGQ